MGRLVNFGFLRFTFQPMRSRVRQTFLKDSARFLLSQDFFQNYGIISMLFYRFCQAAYKYFSAGSILQYILSLFNLSCSDDHMVKDLPQEGMGFEDASFIKRENSAKLTSHCI